MKRTAPMRLVASLLAAVAAAGLLGALGPSARADDTTPNIDLTTQGLVLQSQRDFRWADFKLGLATNEKNTFGRCGCLLAALSTAIEYTPGFGGNGSLPWFAHTERSVVDWGTQQVLSFAPNYLDEFLISGRNPAKPRQRGWGYTPDSGKNCGVFVEPWGLEDVAIPASGNGSAFTPSGFTVKTEDGWHPEIAAGNIILGRPTIIGVQLPDGSRHAELIVGWDSDQKQFLAVDPMWESGAGGAPGFTLDPTPGLSPEQGYAHWLSSIVMTMELEPTNVAHRWLWLEDDPEPVRLLSIDPGGRREGFDPETGAMVHEDPRAFSRTFTSWADPLGEVPAADPARALYVEDPVEGTYGFEIVGIGNGPFTLQFGTTVDHQATVAQTVTGTISKGEVLRYEVTCSPGGTAAVRRVDQYAPRAHAGNDFSTFVSQPVHFDGRSSYDIGGAIASYAWDFGDGSSATGATVSHAYATPGTYVAKLTIKSARGLSASDTRLLKIFGGSSKTTVRASVRADGRELVTTSWKPAISADGRYVAFESSGDFTNDGTSGSAIFVKNLASGAVERIGGLGSASGRPAISADGRFVAFTAVNFVPGDLNYRTDVLVHDRTTGATESVASWVDGAVMDSGHAAISADGRFVAFASRAPNLVPGDTNLISDVFVHDRTTGATERVSVTSTGAENPPGLGLTGGAAAPAISADGRYVAFVSDSPHFVADDSNFWQDVFVRDRRQQTTERASLSNDGRQLESWSVSPAISADGRFVAFSSQARGVTPDDESDWENVFVRDRQTATTDLISVSTRGVSGDAQSSTPAISRDGRYVAFWSLADDLVPGDTNRQPEGETPRGADVFVRDREQRTTERASVSTAGEQALPNGVGGFMTSAVADDGTVAFEADATNLVPNDSNSWADVFVRSSARAQGTRPLANLSGPYVGWASSPIRLDAGGSLSPGGGPLTASWSFGDGSSAASGALQASHVYAEPGTYTVSVTVREGDQESEPERTTVDVLPALGAEALFVTPTCGGPGSVLTIRGLTRGRNAALLEGGWDLSKGPLRPEDVELVLPWATVSATPVPATFSFERTVVVPAVLANGRYQISVEAGPDATFVTPCPAPSARRPVADAGGPIYTGGAGQPLTLDGSRSRDPDGSALTYRWTFGDGTTGSGIRPTHSYRAGGTYFLSLIVNDGRNDSASGVGTRAIALAVISADAIPPVTDAEATPPPNPAGSNNGDVTVRLTARDNDGGSGVKEIVYAMAGAQTGGETVAGAVARVTISAEGQTTLSYFARDNAGNAGDARTLTIRVDKTAPVLQCAASPSVLWPPNHRLVPVDVRVTLADALSGSADFKLVGVASSEPDDGLGDGDTPGDIQGFTAGTPDTNGELRAERSGVGPGRVYSLVYEGKDAAGNASRCTARVTVPHDLS